MCVSSWVRTVAKSQTGDVHIAATTGIVCVLQARCSAAGHCGWGGVCHVSVKHVIFGREPYGSEEKVLCSDKSGYSWGLRSITRVI